jgi:hypothetical protein
MALNLPLPQSRVPNYAQAPELFPAATSTEPAPLDVVPVAPEVGTIPPSPFTVAPTGVTPPGVDPIAASYAAMSGGQPAPVVDPIMASYLEQNPNVDTTPLMPPTTPQATPPVEPTVMNATPQGTAGTGGQGTGGTSTGGGLLPVSEQRTGSMYPPGTEDNLKKAVDEQQKVMTNVKGIYERLDAETKPLFASLAAKSADLESFLDTDSEGYKAFAQKVNDVKTKMDAAHADLAEFQKTAAVDPARFYKDTPFLQHAMNGIAMLMEAKTAGAMIRAGLPPPTGLVMGRIDKAINDDIARQRAEITSKEAGMTNTVNRYRDNLKMLGDERAAEFKTRAEMLQQIGQTIQATKAKYDGELNTANLDKALADTEVNYVKATAEMNKWLVQQGFAAPAGPSKEQREAEERKKEKMVNVLGTEEEARTPDDAKQLKEKSATIHTIVDKLSMLKALRARAGAVDLAGFATEDAKTAQTLMGTAMMDLKEYWKAGALDAGLLTFLESVLSKPNAWTQVMDQYEALEDAVVNKYYHDLNQLVRPDGEPYEFVTVKNMLQGFSNKMMSSMDVDAMIKAKREAEKQSKKPAPALPPVKMGTQAGSFGFGK